MTIASRLYAGLAAFALVFAGMAVVAPSTAQAQNRTVPTALVAGVVITATVVTAIVLLDKSDKDDDEGPQSP
jgi:hypothetical protein